MGIKDLFNRAKESVNRAKESVTKGYRKVTSAKFLPLEVARSDAHGVIPVSEGVLDAIPAQLSRESGKYKKELDRLGLYAYTYLRSDPEAPQGEEGENRDKKGARKGARATEQGKAAVAKHRGNVEKILSPLYVAEIRELDGLLKLRSSLGALKGGLSGFDITAAFPAN
ncbi:MAG: hypothetical protein LBP36_01135 [Oscillospiraceae bacterium]|nr:hypothetical protein [Oscillospiraceae bacterium]